MIICYYIINYTLSGYFIGYTPVPSNAIQYNRSAIKLTFYDTYIPTYTYRGVN